MHELGLSDFILYISKEKHFSNHTTKSYSQDLRDFKDFLRSEFEIHLLLEIKHVHIRSWLASMATKELQSTTINRKISSLKSFFKYHKASGNMALNPMRKIISPKNKKSLPKFIPSKDIASVFTRRNEADLDYASILSTFIIRLFYETGMRSAELINLKLSDINHYKHYLKVLGKGGKERLIPIRRELLEEIIGFISKRSMLEEKHSDHLILNFKGMKADPKFIYNLVNRELSTITLNEQKSPHVLRHSFATHLADNGAEINAIKELLGHSSLRATQVYTHNSIQRIKEAYELAHPKALKE
ncbi:MAG: tyrosine-type recombinase/integrase [Saprospiraceae bacterium]